MKQENPKEVLKAIVHRYRKYTYAELLMFSNRASGEAGVDESGKLFIIDVSITTDPDSQMRQRYPAYCTPGSEDRPLTVSAKVAHIQRNMERLWERIQHPETSSPKEEIEELHAGFLMDKESRILKAWWIDNA